MKTPPELYRAAEAIYTNREMSTHAVAITILRLVSEYASEYEAKQKADDTHKATPTDPGVQADRSAKVVAQ